MKKLCWALPNFLLEFFILFVMILPALSFFGLPLQAARPYNAYQEDRGPLLREILDSMSELKNEVNNHETEIRIFSEKFKSQEEIFESQRQQLADFTQSIKELLRAQTNTIESKSHAHQHTAQEITQELKQHAQESAHLLADYKKRIEEIEKMILNQNQTMEHLQTALSALTELLQPKTALTSEAHSVDSAKIYRVKSGDSLEKIAKQYNTTVKLLKELNNLTKDQIIIGQKLSLPE